MDEGIISGIVEEVEAELESVNPKFRQSVIDKTVSQLVVGFGYDTHHQEEVVEARRRLEGDQER